MELYSAEAELMKKLVTTWLSHRDYELETTFGGPLSRVSASTFDAVAQRLRAKGYRAIAEEDRMVILTPEHFRFTLSSLAIVEAYCRDNQLAGKPFDAQLKYRATAESQVDLDDYDTRIKLRRETPLASDDAQVKKMLESWPQQRKAFRIQQRWSFEGDGIRFDLSIVRSTKQDARGEYRWQRSFQDQKLTESAPFYEIEVELVRKPDDTPETALKRLVKGIGEILRGIQKHTVLIRKTQKEKVIAAYKQLTGTDLFRGPGLLVLMNKNFVKKREPKTPNIRDGYNVTDKADGQRCLGFVDKSGDLYLIDMGMNIYRTGLRRPELRLSLVDGEWVTQTKDEPPKPMQQFHVFDIFYQVDGRDVSQFPFQPGAVPPPPAPPPAKKGEKPVAVAATAVAAAGPLPPEDSRHFQLEAWTKAWNAGDGPRMTAAGLSELTKLQVVMKKFEFGTAGKDDIFLLASRVLAAVRPYYTDGLIFTPNALPLPSKPNSTFFEQFKWKPAADNTIDFLVKFEKKEKGSTEDKITRGFRPDSDTAVTYKTLRLYVGSQIDNPRDVILNKKEVSRGDRWRKDAKYRPVLFSPSEFPDPMASVCYLPIHRDEETGEEYVRTEEGHQPILHDTIVEMAYDPAQPPGWRWKPLRIRMDKTERYQRRIIARTLNSAKVANETWETIYDPITVSMIRTGAATPSEEELRQFAGQGGVREAAARRYFERKAPAADANLVKGMRMFHNQFIKEGILYKAGLSGAGKHLLDLACGQANDLHIWRRMGTVFVLGIDYAAQNILGPSGAYERYMGIVQEAGSVDAVDPMLFAIADTSKPLVNPPAGENGGTEEDKDLLRAVFGRVKPQGELPVLVREQEGRLKEGADCVSCMFALHYFFESQAKFQGFLNNLNDTLKVGGYFIGCCFDGDMVFQLLRGISKGQSRVGMEAKAQLWKISKEYEADDLPTDDTAFGMGIDVEFVTVGMGHREYLVPFKLLVDKLRGIGCELLQGEELREVGLDPALKMSTATFNESYATTRKVGPGYFIGDTAKAFSFLNRWFIFKRKRQATMAEAAAAEAEAAVTATQQRGEAAVAAASNTEVGAMSTAVGRAATLRRNALATTAAATKAQEELARSAALGETAAAVANAATLAEPGTAAAAAAAVPTRTVPVAPGQLAAPEAAAAAVKTYSLGQLFQFYPSAAKVDVLGIKEPGAGRWLAPTAPFALTDPDDALIVYPTLEHYMAGRLVRTATNKPELAATLFGREGTIHQRFLQDRIVAAAGGKLSEEQDQGFIIKESAAVKAAMEPAALKKLGAVVDTAKWALAKDAELRAGLTQRWNSDARFKRIIEEARNKGKYLLYYTGMQATNTNGGVRDSKTGQIKGENRMGKIMMELAGYPA